MSLKIPIIFALFATFSFGDEWSPARAGYQYNFPADHFSHPDFKTEWWYATGNLKAIDSDQRFGVQFTIFRSGIRPPSSTPVNSKWIVDSFGFGHFAISDLTKNRFHFNQELARGSMGDAGFPEFSPDESSAQTLAFLPKSRIELIDREKNVFRLVADLGTTSYDLTITPTREQPVFHGADGISQKGAGAENASHYYSYTRMRATGTITTSGKPHQVTGTMWLDREWASNQLGPDQIGWDWFAIQLDDGSEIMIYQMRTSDGGTDPYSHGTIIAKDGTTTPVKHSDYSLSPVEMWTSPKTGATYPVKWKLTLPKLSAEFTISAAFPEQELALDPVSYYEGAVLIDGERNGGKLTGRGYMELTGYAAPLRQLQSK